MSVLSKFGTAGLETEAIQTRSEAELMTLPNVKEQLDQATQQLQGYRQKLRQKYQDDLNLRTYAVLSLGFDRVLWVGVEG